MPSQSPTTKTIEKMRQAKLSNPVRYWLGTGKVKKRTCPTCNTLFFPKGYVDKQVHCSKRCTPPWNKGKKTGQKVWNAGKTGCYSEETRIKMGMKNRGVARSKEFRLRVSQALTKGNTPLLEAVRKCFEYRDWRARVLKKDKFQCQICKVVGGRLEVDHYPVMFIELIKLQGVTSLEEALNNTVLWDIKNGRALCRPCHKKHGRKKPLLCQS